MRTTILSAISSLDVLLRGRYRDRLTGATMARDLFEMAEMDQPGRDSFDAMAI
jgi:hypothetical protein